MGKSSSPSSEYEREGIVDSPVPMWYEEEVPNPNDKNLDEPEPKGNK